MRLQSRQIEAFRAVMLTGGMTAAAETLHIVQSAVSRLIKDLEEALETSLFHRRGNQLTPTPEAVELFSEVERSYVGLASIAKYARELRDGQRGSLRIAAHPAMAMSFLPGYVASFVASRPDLSVLLDGMPSHLVLERVAGGQFDIGFASFPTERPSLTLTPIPAAAVVVVRADHRLAALDQICAEDLTGEKIILLGRGGIFRHRVEDALGPVARAQKIETPLSGIACAFVAEGLGVTVADPFSAVGFLERGVVVRSFVPTIDVGTVLVSASHRAPSRVAEEFIARVRTGVDTYLSKLRGP